MTNSSTFPMRLANSRSGKFSVVCELWAINSTSGRQWSLTARTRTMRKLLQKHAKESRQTLPKKYFTTASLYVLISVETFLDLKYFRLLQKNICYAMNASHAHALNSHTYWSQVDSATQALVHETVATRLPGTIGVCSDLVLFTHKGSQGRTILEAISWWLDY